MGARSGRRPRRLRRQCRHSLGRLVGSGVSRLRALLPTGLVRGAHPLRPQLGLQRVSGQVLITLVRRRVRSPHRLFRARQPVAPASPVAQHGGAAPSDPVRRPLHAGRERSGCFPAVPSHYEAGRSRGTGDRNPLYGGVVVDQHRVRGSQRQLCPDGAGLSADWSTPSNHPPNAVPMADRRSGSDRNRSGVSDDFSLGGHPPRSALDSGGGGACRVWP